MVYYVCKNNAIGGNCSNDEIFENEDDKCPMCGGPVVKREKRQKK